MELYFVLLICIIQRVYDDNIYLLGYCLHFHSNYNMKHSPAFHGAFHLPSSNYCLTN